MDVQHRRQVGGQKLLRRHHRGAAVDAAVQHADALPRRIVEDGELHAAGLKFTVNQKFATHIFQKLFHVRDATLAERVEEAVARLEQALQRAARHERLVLERAEKLPQTTQFGVGFGASHVLVERCHVHEAAEVAHRRVHKDERRFHKCDDGVDAVIAVDVHVARGHVGTRALRHEDGVHRRAAVVHKADVRFEGGVGILGRREQMPTLFALQLGIFDLIPLDHLIQLLRRPCIAACCDHAPAIPATTKGATVPILV